jgi:hypothetical protein
MINAKFVKPRAFPWNNDRDPEQIDRAQEIGGDLTLNREKVFEIGRVDRLGFRKQTPSFAYSMRQFEYGSMKFWYDLANKETPGSGDDHYIDLDSLDETKMDIAAFLTDADNTFRGTIWFPKLRVNGFSINVADPDAIVERNFDLVGEDYKMLDEKYFAFQKATASGSGSFVETITLSPVAIEYESGKYVFRVLRVRAGTVSELVEDNAPAYAANTWRYSAGDVIVQSCEDGDIIKVYYASNTAYTTTWTDNNVDQDLLLAEYCEIYLKVGTQTRIYRLQTVGIDVALDRTDYKEIGNSEIVQTGVTSQTVTVSLNKFAEDFSLEDILADDNTYPLIDPRNFSEEIKLLVKIYDDKAHTNFKLGYLITGLTPTTVGTTQAVEANMERTVALESTNLKISDLESELTL